MLLKDVIITAVTKSLKAPKLEPGGGSFKGRVVLDLDVEVVKGEPVEFTPTVKLEHKAVLAACLARAGIQRDRLCELLESAYNDVLNSGGNMSDYLPLTEKAIEKVEATLAKLPKETRSGPTSVKGSVAICKIVEQSERRTA